MSKRDPIVRIISPPPDEGPVDRRPLPRREDRCRLLSPELQASLEREIVVALLQSLARITHRSETSLHPDLAAAVSEFFPLYEQRPVQNNIGGSLFNDSLCLYLTARLLVPTLIVESGTFRGHSAWLLRRACPEAEILSFDIDLSQLEHREPDVTYYEGDWTDFPLPAIAAELALIWFDDHINQAMRLYEAHNRGFRRALFDDNFPAYNLYATGGAPVPTLAMAIDETLHDGMRLVWTRHGKTYEYVYEQSHTFDARSLICLCQPLPDLAHITRYSPSSALTYVETVP